MSIQGYTPAPGSFSKNVAGSSQLGFSRAIDRLLSLTMSYPKLYLKKSSGVSVWLFFVSNLPSNIISNAGLVLFWLTWNRIGRDEFRGLSVYLLWLVLTRIAKHLHNTCSLHSNFLKSLKTLLEILWSAACQCDSKGHRIFDGLGTTLSLVLIESLN